MTGLSPGSGLVGPPGLALGPGLGSAAGGRVPGSGASSSSSLPVSCRRSPEGRGCCRQGGRRRGRRKDYTGDFRWRPQRGSVGAGAGAGVWCGGLARGRGLPPGLLPGTHPPPTPTPPPGGSSLRTGQSWEVAGRGLLASCLLSRGLISKTGRLLLTEAADGTADAPARLSSWGPAPAPWAAHRPCPQMQGRSPTLRPAPKLHRLMPTRP